MEPDRTGAAPPAPPGGQDWHAATYARNAGFVPALGADVLALLDPRPGERILDIGCGDGVLTAQIAAAGAEVNGLEPAPDLAAAAERRGLRVWRQDAREPWPEGGFDAVFSNAALHWITGPAPVLDRAFAALKPGGRFVAEQGGFGNVAAVVTALNAARAVRGLPACRPWDFPSPLRQAARLLAAGFAVEEIVLIPRPTPLPTGMAGWLATFAGPFLVDLDEAARLDLLAEAEALMPALHEPEAGWFADYVRLRFKARRPA
jgi:SAM-dependent methyltransferase